MKQKFKNLSIPVGIALSLLFTALFVGLLTASGLALGMIPGIAYQDEYLLQAISELIILIIFLIITRAIGYDDIFKENKAGWLRSFYTGGFFVVYCLYCLLSQVYSILILGHGNLKPFYEILFYIIAIFLVGLVEEFVFRGVILNILLNSFSKTKKGITGAIVFGGVLFGLMHFINMASGVKFSSAIIQVISTSLLGILFCTVYASTRNFWIVVLFHTVVDLGSLLSTGLFDDGGIVSQINTYSAMNAIAFVILGIPMFVMLRKSRRIRMEMLYNNIPVIDDENEGRKLGVVSLVLGICSLAFSCIGYLGGLGIVGLLASRLSKKARPYDNSLATAGMVTSIVGIVLSVISTIILIIFYASGIASQFTAF